MNQVQRSAAQHSGLLMQWMYLLPAKTFSLNKHLNLLLRLCVTITLVTIWSSAQALVIQTRVYPKPMFGNGGLTPGLYNTSQAAFEAGKTLWDSHPTLYNPNSKSALNLHPAVPAPQISLNNIPAYHYSDTKSCAPPNGCTISPNTGITVFTNLICPKGFGITFQFPGPQDYYARKHVCLKETYIPEPCDDCGRGNPILPGGGQKLQIETDYTSANGSLQFKRSYRSTTGTFSSAATSGGLIDHSIPGQIFPSCYWGLYQNGNKLESHCFPYVSSGKPEYQLMTPEGKLFTFSGPLNAIKPKADVNDKIFQRINEQAQTEWVAQRSDNSTEIYSTLGLLQRKVSVDGSSTTTYTYSDVNTPPNIAPRPGMLLSMTDQAGRQLRFTYNPAGQLISLTDPADGVYQYLYNSIGNLIKRISPDNQERLYHYNEPTNINNGVACNYPPEGQPGALTGITDENATRLADYKYNCDGKAVSTEHTGGVEKYSFTYSGYTSATEIDPLGTTRKYTFADIVSAIRPTSTTQPGPNGQGTVSSSITYDAQGNIASQVDFSGERSCYNYELSRNLEAVRIEGLPGANACPANVAAHILPTPVLGSTVTQRKISTQWHPNWRLPVKRAQPNAITIWVYHGQPDPTAGNAIASCAPAQALLPDDKPIAVLCKQIEQATTDVTGSSGFAAIATPGVAPRIWTYTYNERGQVLTADGPRTDNGILDRTTYTYHPATTSDVMQGDLASITNAAGQTTTFTHYDKHGRVLRSTDAYGLRTEHTYHARGWLLSTTVTAPANSQESAQANTSSFEYDATGQLIKASTPEGGNITYSYDAAHRLIGITDTFGNSITYTLDPMGNRLQEHTKDPNAVLAQQVNRVLDALNRVQQSMGSAQ
jgi:YD repeat-containing protein